LGTFPYADAGAAAVEDVAGHISLIGEANITFSLKQLMTLIPKTIQ
jgi:hypothetical protein